MNLDGVGDHPDFDLAKAVSQSFLESPEKGARFRSVLDINDYFDVGILEGPAFVRPNSLQPLWRPSHCAKFSDQFPARLGKVFLLDRKSVVIPCGQENFVPLEGHRLG